MTDSLRFRALISTTGSIQPDDAAHVRARLQRWRGKRVEVQIEPERRSRSDQQTRYWWGVVVPHAQEWSGYEKREMSDALLSVCGPREIVRFPGGKTVERIRPLSDLNMAETSELIDSACRWLAQQGCYVPHPDEPWEVMS